MKLTLIRHGQSEHTVNLPDSLRKMNPKLTPEGIINTTKSREKAPVSQNDILFVSPTTRTIETANILNKYIQAEIYTHPFIGPRIFPERIANTKIFDPNSLYTLPCDWLLSKREIKIKYPSLKIIEGLEEKYWDTGYINNLQESDFTELLNKFLKQLYQQTKSAVFISHDGNINSIRKRLTRQNFTRKDFLSDSGFITIEI